MKLSELLLGLGEERKTMWHSQFEEDRWIYDNLRLPDRGIFCEVGAFDGVQSSNTLFFEEEFDWAGICIEPVPELAAQCRKNRKCITVCCGAGSAAQWGSLYRQEDPGRSVIGPFVSTVEPTPIFRLDLMLPVFGMRPNLLSIDTEGTELEVWEGARALQPDIVIIEYLQWGSDQKKQPICSTLDRDGYKVVRCTEANLIFVKK